MFYSASWEQRQAQGSWDERAGSATEGGVSNNASSGDVSLALDISGNPHIAWQDAAFVDFFGGTYPQVYYRYWNPADPSLSPKICRTCPPAFSVKQGKTKCKKFKIWNCGAGTLNWTVSEDCDWLTLTPSSGTSTWEKDTVKACVNTAGLEKGAYPCTVTVTGEGASNSP